MFLLGPGSIEMDGTSDTDTVDCDFDVLIMETETGCILLLDCLFNIDTEGGTDFIFTG